MVVIRPSSTRFIKQNNSRNKHDNINNMKTSAAPVPFKNLQLNKRLGLRGDRCKILRDCEYIPPKKNLFSSSEFATID